MPKKPFNLEESIADLEQIVENLSSKDYPLKENFSLYEKGVETYLACLEEIKKQENKISILKNKTDLILNNSEEPILEEFESTD